MNNSTTIHRFLPVFALQLSDELPLLFVHIKVDAPVRYHLKDTQHYWSLLSSVFGKCQIICLCLFS